MPKPNVPAAQYIRMSTEHQRFSPDNQKAAIAAYALKHGFNVVETYQDSGKSGLTLSGRPALKRLLSDVLSGCASYKAILVPDVSRWGRFQDADQAAHYEYMCREAGVPVFYCCEAFDNDGGSMAAIVKHMKRVMAAEYSRELSSKIARAQRQQARLGYKQGGTAVIGTRRQVVDENGKPRMLLAPGQQKSIATDKVVYVEGPLRETKLVRRIFALYVEQDLTITGVAEALNRDGKKQPTGKIWDYNSIKKVLGNELYTGIYIFGRQSNNLGKRKKLRSSEWSKAVVMSAIVSKELFERAARKREQTRRLFLSDDELKERLSLLWKENGFITAEMVQACPYLPHPYVFRRRFGGIREACRAIGYNKPFRASRRNSRVFSDEELLENLRRIYAEKGKISRDLIDTEIKIPSSGFYQNRFGNLRNAYLKAGIGFSSSRSHAMYLNKDGSTLSHNDLLSLLRPAVERFGYLTGSLIDSYPDCPSAWLYTKRFGGLLEVYKHLGLSSTKSMLAKDAASRRRHRATTADHRAPEIARLAKLI